MFNVTSASGTVLILGVRVFPGDVEQVDGAEKITIRIFKNITLIHEAGMVRLEVRDTTDFVRLCL